MPDVTTDDNDQPDGRILAIGDIHGCSIALETLLQSVAVKPQDTVVFLGDAVDRGPESRQAIDQILSLRERCKVIFIAGNHEQMMRQAISGSGLMDQWLQAGGQATVDSYGGSLDNVPPEHIRFLVSGVAFWESENDIFVHACLESNISLTNQTSDYLRWKHLGGMEAPHVSGKRVVCGHTAQRDGVPLVFDGWACIDTFAHGGKWLSCLDVNSDLLVQASEQGDVREFPLSKYA